MKVLCLVLLCCFFSAVSAASDRTDVAPAFQELVGESGMVFELPQGYRAVDAEVSHLFPHERALVNAAETLQIRYAIRPLSRIQVDYQDPHSSTPDPNHMFPLMFQSLVTRLSHGGHSPTREYSPDQAEQKFHADWAAASVFDLHPEMQGRFSQALIIAMHKNKLADAYVLYLFNDYQQVKDDINGTLGALAFLP